MTTAALTDHRKKGFFVFEGGWEYTAIVAAAATALAGLGNGRWSVDGMRSGTRRSGAKVAIGAAAFGIISSGALLAASYRPSLVAGNNGIKSEASPDDPPALKIDE